MLAFFQSSKHFLEALSGIVFSFLHGSCFMASFETKRVPWSCNFSSGNGKKSQAAKSDEYRGWWMVFFAFLAWHSVTTVAPYDGTLLSREIHGQIVFFIDRLSLWNEFVMHQTTNFRKNNKHYLDFWATSTWLFRFQLVFVVHSDKC